MKAFLKSVVAGLLAVLLTLPAAVAQNRPAFSPEELDQMLAPIALYPDSLLSQILMAATYPLEVVQAARWSRANSQLKGQDAVRAVEPMDWDPSVKSLVAFPQILHRMDEQLDWTQRLGEAFLEQEPHVMDAIQGLRQRAERAGNLRSNEQMRVIAAGRAHPHRARAAASGLRAVLRPVRGLRTVGVAGLSARLLGCARRLLRRARVLAGFLLGHRDRDFVGILLRPRRLAPSPGQGGARSPSPPRARRASREAGQVAA